MLAVRAFAWGQDTYCDGCTLPASGVPAVSAAHHPSFYFGNMNTGAFSHNYFYEEIYFYSATANKVMCAGAALTNQGVTTTPMSGCTTGYSDTDSRCHLLQDTGPARATCFAYYSDR